MSVTDILNAYFPPPERPSELTIEVLDSCTNSGRAPTAPTTISWCDGHAAEGVDDTDSARQKP